MKILTSPPQKKQDDMHNIRNYICIKIINSDIGSQKIYHYCREMPSKLLGENDSSRLLYIVKMYDYAIEFCNRIMQ